MVKKPTYDELELRIKTLERQVLDAKKIKKSTRAARKNYKRFLRFLPYPVVVRNSEERITYLNPAFTKTFGWTLRELKGKKGDQYVPDHLKDELITNLKALPTDKSVLKMETKRFTKDGNILDIILRIGVDKDENNNPEGMIIVLRDVTMKNRTKKNKRSLNRIRKVLPEYPDLKKLMLYINTEVKELLNTESANTILLDKSQKEFYFLSATHDNPTTRERIEKARFSVDELLSGQVLKTGKPIMVNNMSHYPQQYQSRDKKIGYKVRNVLLAPLQRRDKIIGILAADNKRNGDFDETDLENLITIATAVALSIENARVSSELRKAYDELKSINNAKDKMISHLSHELKTPVAILISSINILEKRLIELPEKKWHPTFERIKRNLKRIIDIEDEVFDIVEQKEVFHSKIFTLILEQCQDEFESLIAEEIGETGIIAKVKQRIEEIFTTRDLIIEKIFLNKFVEERIQTIKQKITDRNIVLISHLKSSSPIHMPIEPLKKTVDGLIRNAIENTPDGGMVEVIVHQKGKGMQFVVKDHGTGLTKEVQKRIFEGFFSTQETLQYSSKRPYDFNAGGKGADLLRMKIFSEKYNFKISMTSKQCGILSKNIKTCSGAIDKCKKEHGVSCDGMTIVTCFFPYN